MKINRLLSISLIFVVLFASPGGGRYVLPADKTSKLSNLVVEGPQFSEDESDVASTFRETLKISISSETKSHCFDPCKDSAQSIFALIHHSICRSFLQAQLSHSPSEKLFLQFRSLLI